MAIPVLISDGERTVSIDHLINVLEVIAHEHSDIHAGNEYRAHITENVTANLNANLTWLTPDSDLQMHTLVSVTTQNSAHAYFYELIEIPDTACAITVTPRNANRNRADNSSVQEMWAGATVNSDGSIVLGDVVLGSAFRKADGVGGALSLRAEFVLKRNTWYSLVIDEESEGDQKMSMLLDWYEHAPETK